ncbi:hypothetical protein GMOD_00005892 [Pyrenophora seminiperda CCB06]|uniref:tRNA/rRNA methyltransferase SpoU type domain-containing protein n=1 Tax=Pyrenophora seminiperda CCB06 TaxID=1302712 RepID=A0A3M7MAD6_9PLEO|nr:hypothetical protein GMOD_00005892 [Pyrenophora seminiperda CCB06]
MSKAYTIRHLTSGAQHLGRSIPYSLVMATATILSLLDQHAKNEAFDASLAKLKAAPHGIDIDTLDICVRLLPSESPELVQPEKISQHEELWDILLGRLVDEESSPERLYKIAETCLSHGPFAAEQLNTKFECNLSSLAQQLPSGETEGFHAIKAYLGFLKCSFWLPTGYCHMANPAILRLLSSFLTIHGLEDVAHDTFSAFFSLLKNDGEDLATRSETINNLSLWDQLNALDVRYFAARSSKIYRTWFQWISLAASNGLRLTCVEDEKYWRKLRLGLVKGHADQRKYCLGIIRQSFLVTQNVIDTPSMQYDPGNVDGEKYELYSTLFETIVLHRYTGQVEDSLPTLTKLLGSSSKTAPSCITAAMTTTLLTAALDPLIQESIRKMVGRWYMNFVIERRGDISGHIHFLFEGFLPWATEGNLFTSTLTNTRTTTVCSHGDALAAVIARFASDTEGKPSFIPSVDFDVQEVGVDNRGGRAVILGVVRYITNARGRLFQPAIMYLLNGLIMGLKATPPLSYNKLEPSEISEILSLARITGLPEVASDLHSIFCRKICDLAYPDVAALGLPTDESLRARCQKLGEPVDQSTADASSATNDSRILSLQSFLKELHESKHSCIQGPAFAPACKSLVELLDHTDVAGLDPDDLHSILAALWEEAEIRDFIRPFAVHLPALLFHPTCIQACVTSSPENKDASGTELVNLLSKAMSRLTRLSKGRSYVLAALSRSLRRAAFANPSIVSILPFEDYIIDFINEPATIRSEFLFEVAAAGKSHQFLPHRTYTSYYGLREWHAYGAVMDLLRRFPEEQLSTAKDIFDRLLQPWKDQQPPVAVKSPWKKTLQLQSILLLSQYCVTESDADAYIDSLTHALTLESWPRYRYLLEWTLARIYHRFPGKSSRIVKELGNLDEYSPIHVASLIKLGLLVAPYESEDFAAKLMTQLNAYSASPKVQIRHEANFAFPLVFDLADAKGWKSVTENPAFIAMNAFIRRLDKFSASPWTIRTLKVDIERDFTLVGIFQGQYLSIESPEEELVTYEDFRILETDDQQTQLNCPRMRIELGTAPAKDMNPIKTTTQAPVVSPPDQAQITLQTKAGIDLDNLHPQTGPPSMQKQRPASVLMIASLIDNPTNLGGLSRISESFGLEALYIDDLKKVAHKDFKATSVRSEKHLAIRELKEVGVPAFLLDAKSKGYEVVGIEQTDRSGILGHENNNGEKEIATEKESAGEGSVHVVRTQDIGTLPRKCCLVLGSEKEGISAEVLAVIDRNVEIKTVGVTRSLNVQTAGGIALYEWWREWGGKA